MDFLANTNSILLLVMYIAVTYGIHHQTLYYAWITGPAARLVEDWLLDRPDLPPSLCLDDTPTQAIEYRRETSMFEAHRWLKSTLRLEREGPGWRWGSNTPIPPTYYAPNRHYTLTVSSRPRYAGVGMDQYHTPQLQVLPGYNNIGPLTTMPCTIFKVNEFFDTPAPPRPDFNNIDAGQFEDAEDARPKDKSPEAEGPQKTYV